MVERNLERRQNEMNEREKKKKENQIHSHIIITNIKRINIFIQIHAKQNWMKCVCVAVRWSGVFFLLLLLFVVGFYLIYTKI